MLVRRSQDNAIDINKTVRCAVTETIAHSLDA